MAEISFRNVTRKLNSGKVAVKDFSLEVREGEFVVIAGPSNSGKATILRMIAGTEPISEGELVIRGEMVEPGKMKKRNVGMIFQNYTLYPGMTIRENLAFNMSLQGEEEQKMAERIAYASKVFRIEKLLDCYPRELSDLQKQYVAMARAYVHEPIAMLILDTLQRLSPTERAKARKQLMEIYEELHNTVIYVTDSGIEVTKLNHHTVIMKNGLIEQQGSVKELQEAPKNLFVAQFMFEPFFCTEIVKVRKTQSTTEAVCEFFGIDIPGEWAEKLEANGFLNKEVLMGYTVDRVAADEDEEKNLPDGDSRLFFFDPKTEKLLV